MARRHVRVVEAAAAVRPRPPVRLQGQHRVPHAHVPQHECPACGGRVLLRGAPGCRDRRAQRLRQRRGQPRVLRHPQHRTRLRVAQPGHDRRRVRHADRISRTRHHPQHGCDACEGVQAHGVARLPADPRVVRQHHRHAPRPGRRARQPRPACRPVRDQVHTLRIHRVDRAGVLQRLVPRRFGLEGHHAGQEPPIQFGQDDLHGEVRGGQAPRRGRPGLPPAARQHGLQHRGPCRIQRGSIHTPGRECRQVHHYRRHPGPQPCGDPGRGPWRLEAVDEHRADIHAPVPQGARQRMDRGHVGRQEVRPVEHDDRSGRAVAWSILMPGLELGIHAVVLAQACVEMADTWQRRCLRHPVDGRVEPGHDTIHCLGWRPRTGPPWVKRGHGGVGGMISMPRARPTPSEGTPPAGAPAPAANPCLATRPASQVHLPAPGHRRRHSFRPCAQSGAPRRPPQHQAHVPGAPGPERGVHRVPNLGIHRRERAQAGVVRPVARQQRQGHPALPA